MELSEIIAALPAGTIIRRKIRGIDRFYHQWREDGQTKSKYLKTEEIRPLRELIEERKALQRQLRTGTFPAVSGTVPSGFAPGILTGRHLLEFAHGVERFQERTIFSKLSAYLNDETSDRILFLSGSLGTGKTTMIRQALLKMTTEERERTAYLHPLATDSPEALTLKLDGLRNRGIRTVFLDDTPPLADLGTSGLKVVLAGTVPVSAMLSGEIPLSERIYPLDASFIPYGEHVRLLGKTDIDRYLEIGGILEATDENAPLVPIRDEELSSEDAEVNDWFVLEVLIHAATHSKDQGLRAAFLANDLHRIQRHFAGQLGEPSEETDILREYLLSAPPRLRYRHARGRILELLDGPACAHLGAAERKLVRDVLLREAHARLMEDAVWHETDAFRTSDTVSVERIRFAGAEYCIVVADRKELTCEVYVTSDAAERNDRQLRHLNDPARLADLEHRYGFVTAREVLYKGRGARHVSGAYYRNVESYLSGLG